MIPVIVAGFAFGVGAAVGQEVAEKHIIPASKKFYSEWCEAWDEFVAECTKEPETK